MQCPKCGATVLTGDRFCEECGAPLTTDAIPNPQTGCVRCGATAEAIDPEGFCTECGFRAEARVNDHIEVIIQPYLAGVSDRGLRHYRNEDFLTCAQVLGKNTYVLVVCDGVSSSQSPDKASQSAAQSACQVLTTTLENGQIASPVATMKTAVAAALRSVCAIPYTKSGEEDPPSTTLVAALVQDQMVTIGWLGDSRAYWISPNGSRQLTQDDSWLNDIVSSGQMTAAEARTSDKAHAITRWLGEDAIADAEPSIVNFPIPGSGHLLLCTDGLWNYAPDPGQIADLVHQGSDTNAISISRRLVEFARNSGGHDNITVALLCL